VADPTLADVGQRIRAYRTAAGQLQHELAAAVGLSRSSIANLEAGRQDITVTTLLGIAHYLGVTPADLLSTSGGIDILLRLCPQCGTSPCGSAHLRAVANQPLPSDLDGEHRG
jgi:transcriptional regulator with XRE-family HTH domain